MTVLPHIIFPSRVACAVALALTVLHGCGGGSDTPPGTTIQVDGRVIDGPLQGAVVCVDIDQDKQCGAGEPQALSGPDGRFAFAASLPASAAMPRIVLAIIDAATVKDADDGGKTLAEAGKPSVVFQAWLSDEASVIVSPLSTLAVNEMEMRGLSPEDAARVAMSSLGLPGNADPNADFSAPDTEASRAMQRVAQAAFLSMGHIGAGLARAGTGASARTLHLASLAETLPVAAYIVNRLDLARPKADGWHPEAMAILASAFDADMYADAAYAGPLLRNAAGGPSQVADILGRTWQAVRDIGPTEFNLTCCFQGTGSLDFASGVNYSRSAYVEGQWRALPDYTQEVFDLDPATGGWARRPVYGALGDLSMPAAGAGIYTARHSGLTSRYSFRETDLAGKSLADVNELHQAIQQFLGDTSARPPSALIFPEGARIAYLGAVPRSDNYLLGGQTAFARGPEAPATFAGLSDMMAYARTPSAPPTEPGKLPHLAAGVYAITFDGLADAGTLTLWDAQTFYNPSGGTRIIGQGTYEIRAVAGQRILVLTYVTPGAVAYGCTTCLEPPGNTRLIFALRDGAVRSGSLELANHIRTPAFWSSVGVWVDKSYTPIINAKTWETLRGWLGMP